MAAYTDPNGAFTPRRSFRAPIDLSSRRWSSRIEKPRSTHPSPSVNSRRKTISATKQYPTLEDHYRAMFPDCDVSNDVEMESTKRPYSWHPSSMSNGMQYQHQLNLANLSGAMQMSPDSIAQDSPQPYPGYAAHTGPSSMASGSSNGSSSATQQDMASWQSYFDDQSTVLANFNSQSSGPYDASTSWYVPDYSQLVQSQPQLLESAAPFPATFLQVHTPQPAAAAEEPAMEEDEEDDEEGEELVGLGLYDPPEPTPLFGPAPSKLLKLVETWQPPEPSSDDDADGEDDDSSEEEEEEDAAGHASERTKVSDRETVPLASSAVTPSAPQNETQLVRGSMAGQSFFFEDNDATVADEWWHKQLKQPSATASSGIGYDWLPSR